MTIAPMLQPDQEPRLWDLFVADYERVFEPLTDSFAAAALDGFGDLNGRSLIDVCAGSGGAVLAGAQRGATVTAVDGSAAMVARIRERASLTKPGAVSAQVMDASALGFEADRFDFGLSCFGVVLLPDAAAGLRELARVVRPGGAIAIVTWTEPERYELVARLRQAAVEVRGAPPRPGAVPAQLRFAEPSALAALMSDACLQSVRIERLEGRIVAPGAHWLADHIGFAPGMAATLDGLGSDRNAVLGRFAEKLEADQGAGAVVLGATAHMAVGRKAERPRETGLVVPDL